MLSTCKQLLRSSTNRLSSTRPLPPHHRSFSVTKLNPHDDTFLLLQHQRKNIYVVGNCHVPKKTADTIFQTINEVKPDTVLVQICQHRADVIHKLSVEHGDNLNEHICGEAALKDFTNQYPTSAGIFCKSKTVIKPFELFGLLFSYADYKAIHAALLNQAQIIFADNKMKQCIARFEKSINKMYDPGYFADNKMKQCIARFEKSINKMYDPGSVLNPDNMFEKDVNYADLQREMAMGGSPKEIHKRMMKTMLERMMKNKKANHDEEKVQKQKKLLINQQLEIDLEKQQQSGGG
eukprot:CAMPEP_0197078020 /NCGR_PEP_ID=MMETSP1384-20130603/212912_1 /TAXON_ID=29189 /ORGANISM="Ammonia sp." /LENGTH=292 /DNA_ID=CAMNT_0042516885 /DNA_START=12 /DNA_END=886 /DNA_ORIENTATION=+